LLFGRIVVETSAIRKPFRTMVRFLVIARNEATKHSTLRHSGMVRKHQTRNLEIPGSMLRIAPE